MILFRDLRAEIGGSRTIYRSDSERSEGPRRIAAGLWGQPAASRRGAASAAPKAHSSHLTTPPTTSLPDPIHIRLQFIQPTGNGCSLLARSGSAAFRHPKIIIPNDV